MPRPYDVAVEEKTQNVVLSSIFASSSLETSHEIMCGVPIFWRTHAHRPRLSTTFVDCDLPKSPDPPKLT